MLSWSTCSGAGVGGLRRGGCRRAPARGWLPRDARGLCMHDPGAAERCGGHGPSTHRGSTWLPRMRLGWCSRAVALGLVKGVLLCLEGGYNAPGLAANVEACMMVSGHGRLKASVSRADDSTHNGFLCRCCLVTRRPTSQSVVLASRPFETSRKCASATLPTGHASARPPAAPITHKKVSASVPAHD